jgi:RND family efflux transporter MFP subunit
LGSLFSVCSGCSSSEQAKKSEPPATVRGAPKESELNAVVLTPDAEKRLGIELVKAELRRVQRTRLFGGEIVVPSEQEIVLSAPVTGRLSGPASGAVPVAGASVKGGEELFRLYPIPSERELLQIRAEVAQAEIRHAAAAKRAARAEQLLKDKAGSVRANEEAQAELASATTALESARERLELLTRASDRAPQSLTPVVIAAPLAGVVTEVHARAGQNVSAGSPIVRIVNATQVWVRVPVYVGELSMLDTRQTAHVQVALDSEIKGGLPARPVQAPPSANAGAATADLYYQVSNEAGVLRPKQRVGVAIPLRETEQALVVPWAAVLYDIHGGAWVYVQSGPHTYSRRRVDQERVVESVAVLRRGPPAGTPVVAAGAAELFGTEFATGK